MKFRTTINPQHFDVTRKELSGEIELHTFDGDDILRHALEEYTFLFVVSPIITQLRVKPQAITGIVPAIPLMPENVSEQIKIVLKAYLDGWSQLKACFWQ